MSLRSKVIRAAYTHPGPVRKALLPLLTEGMPGRKASTHRRAHRKADLSEVMVGDIFVSSWGYDQTNVDYYQVVKRTAKTVTVKELEKVVVSGGRGPTERVMPVKDRFNPRGKTLRKKLKDYSGVPYLDLSSYASAYLWDGKPQYQTRAVFGH